MTLRFVPRALAALVSALVFGSCAHTKECEVEKGPALTAEARAMLDHALQRPEASGLVMDLAAVEDAGLSSRGDGLQRTAELMTAALPWFATSEQDPELRQFLGRISVATAVLREWTEWPNVRGIAVSMPDVAQAAETGQPPVSQAVVILAVARDQDSNRQLLEGVLALGRASVPEQGGHEVKFEVRGQDACVIDPKGEPVCLRPGNGYLLVGAPDAMSAYEKVVTTPEAAATDAFHAQDAQAMPVLLHARLSMREQGTANLFIRGKEKLGIYASVESQSPALLARAEQVVRDQLARYDQRRAEQKELLAQSLENMKQRLAADPQAPPTMKQLAQALTVEKVMDPHGWWAEARTSLKTERVGQSFAVSLTVPAGAVDALSKNIREGGSSVAVSGVLAAIAVPNFIKFQCRSKQSEVKSNLKSIVTAQKSFAAENNRYGKSFAEIGFAPETPNRYTYCMGKECLPCSGPDCLEVHGENPCAGMSGVGKTLQDGFQACAFGNVDSDPGLDVWVIDDRGAPENGENDCAE